MDEETPTQWEMTAIEYAAKASASDMLFACGADEFFEHFWEIITPENGYLTSDV